ncbi:hypothetical protein [uncultured Oscillibacter sp.]|jgi:hypothetical protein|uniref:hypothetical protein n=1 Tax=uncultured Oscillibacter sp. TaxID=876091 RepID=UPI00216FE089|nr:hypothetical protein [uncultured Oscillibacter sp.]MCI9554360.1 hypothetical protein [Oscillibacter sp.]
MRNQDTFYRMLDTLRTGAEAAGTLALGTLGLACEGAEKLAEAARLRFQAARVEGEMDEKLMEAGEMVYATHTGNPTESEELVQKLREIDGLKTRLAELNETLGRTPEGPVCPDCGKAVGAGDHFCRFCGGKLD